MARRRLDHVDAMRPVKQAGVISTHAVLYLAPAAASLSSGAALLLLHVSREGFFFISACMLTYAYAGAVPGDGGDRAHRGPGADRHPGPDAAGGAAHRARPGALAAGPWRLPRWRGRRGRE